MSAAPPPETPVAHGAFARAAATSSPAAAPLTPSAALPVFGCPRAHCDGANSDLSLLPVPPAGAVEVWHRAELQGEAAGSRHGLGCSANGVVAVCTYAGESDNVVAYDFDGQRLWSSGPALNQNAWASAPLILSDGSVIASDDRVLVRIDAQGTVMWQSPLEFGGLPISPVTTDDGSVVVLATKGGPVYAFDTASGERVGLLFVQDGAGDPGFFDTVNTPAVRGSRVYVLTRHQAAGVPDPDGRAWLVALDVAAAGTGVDQRLLLAWTYQFIGPSRASPLRIGPDLFFDAAAPGPGLPRAPQILAVRDTGPAPGLLWQRPAGGEVLASFARDPRPGSGFWMYLTDRAWLIRRAARDGAVIQTIDLDALIAEPASHVPLSAITIGGTVSQPTLVAAATAFSEGPTYVAAVDLTSGNLRWKVPVPDIGGWYTAGQFPTVMRGGSPRIVFTTYNSGARAIGAP